ncbi:hypothetical protein A6A40_09140 [Azospirillum humicireducens]|uniref:Uncharacterized protein n=1 Tax=Azospirillum humicireducens TaxID=1226968 RepID=A0A160JGJ5_9PROT|nr:hypothetical protein [Azospirillum humicireducens]ANC92056.1 hypothetical protein A6A40_09140 [Azospirillum humicireducens]
MSAPDRDEPPALRRRERMAGLFLLAAVLFSPPLLGLFGVEATIFGIPALYAGVFGVWAAVILLAALAGRTR